MAYLEKKILVTIPVTEAHKTYLEKQASSGKYNCQFRYIPKEHVTKEDLEDTQVLTRFMYAAQTVTEVLF